MTRPQYHPAVAGALAKYVDAFVDGVSADLSELSGRDHRAEVVVDAGDLVAAVIDSDTRQTAAELEAWLDDIGPRLDPPVIVTSDRLRESAMLDGKRRWLDRPSTLADLLLRADARDGGRRAARYYDLAIRLAHAAASVDLVPSPDEIAAIDRYPGCAPRRLRCRRGRPPGTRPAGPDDHGHDRGASRPRPPPHLRPNPSCRPSDRSKRCSPSSTRSSGCSR